MSLSSDESSGVNRMKGLDRISGLDDDILRKILSLVSTKAAIRTGAISARWKDLWKSVHRLVLHDEPFPDDAAFINFVNEFLDLGGDLLFDKFELKVNWEVDINRWTLWVDTLIRRGIQEFVVENIMDDKFELPSSLLRSNTLVSLKLDRVVLNVPEVVVLPNLKSMYLRDMEYADDFSVDRLISSCGNLEVLLMSRNPDDNCRVLCVRSNSLKSFEVEFESLDDVDFGDQIYQVVIDTPRLEYLYFDDPISESIDIRRLGPAAKVELDVKLGVDIDDGLNPDDPEARDSVRSFLNGISTASHLIVSRDTLQVIYFFWRLESSLPKFYSLSRLEATLEWRIFPALLHSCPNLKQLVLAWDENPTDMETRLSVIPELMTSLEFLEIETPVKGDAEEMKLIKFFLKNSVVLKKVTISVRSSGLKQKRSDITKEIKKCPRSSPGCQVRIIRR